MSSDDPREDVRAAAAQAFPQVVASAFGGTLTFIGERQEDGGAARYVLLDADGAQMTVRVEAAPLPAGSLARLHTNTHTDNHVIQLSSDADARAVAALLAAQLHELYAVRAAAARAAAARPLNLLVPGPALPFSPHLTAADIQRLGDLNQLARDMNDPALGTRPRREARDKFSALLDSLGLREAGRGTGDAQAVQARQAIAAAELTAPAAAALRELGRPIGQLNASDAAALRRHRTAAQRGSRAAAWRREAAPAAGTRWHELPALALTAEQTRAARSAVTLAHLRDRQARLPSGQHPRMPVMIGGGAALAGRQPQMLVISARQGWHEAILWALSQTADQLQPIAATGFGNPSDFVIGQQRIPLEALRYWEDRAAACGPVINGTAVLRPGGNGALLAEISPADGSPPLTVEAVGHPVIATGFPAERVPGYALPVPTLPAAAHVLARHHPDAWPQITGALARPAPGQALATWLRQAGHGLAGPGDDSLLPHAAQTIDATAAWETAQQQTPGLVVMGDDLTYGRASPLAAKRWLIAGTGGSSYTAAEIILAGNPDAEAVMVGIGAREPVRNLPLYTSVTRAHVAAEGGDGRLTVVEGQPLIGQVEMTQKAGRPVFRALGYEGDAYVACLGRAGFPPPAAEPLAAWTYARHGRLDGQLMYDLNQQFLGYRLGFSAAGERHEIEVTGAASRALPTQLFGPDVMRRVAGEWRHEIPPESGHVPGGYLPTVLQAHRYRSARAETEMELLLLPAR